MHTCTYAVNKVQLQTTSVLMYLRIITSQKECYFWFIFKVIQYGRSNRLVIFLVTAVYSISCSLNTGTKPSQASTCTVSLYGKTFNKTSFRLPILPKVGTCHLHQPHHCYTHNTKSTWYSIVVEPNVKCDAPMAIYCQGCWSLWEH